MISIELKGEEELKKAILRNPRVVKREVGNYLVRAMAKLTSGIKQRPWQVGGSGGGTPVDTGRLLQSHKKLFKPLSAILKPDTKYDKYVHEGTKRMKARPWLDWVAQDKKKDIEKLQDKLLSNIVKDLAK